VRCGAFNPDSTMSASGAVSGEVLLVNLLHADDAHLLQLDGAPHAANKLQFSVHQKTHLAVVYDDGTVAVWDTRTQALYARFDAAHNAAATAVTFSPYNPLLLCSVGLDGHVIFFDMTEKMYVLCAPPAVAFFDNANRVSLTCWDKTLPALPIAAVCNTSTAVNRSRRYRC
jgi:WD40 repeat protein